MSRGAKAAAAATALLVLAVAAGLDGTAAWSMLWVFLAAAAGSGITAYLLARRSR